jgi:hypothetical protein
MVGAMPRMGNIWKADMVGGADAAEEDGIHLQLTWLIWDAGRCNICLHKMDSIGPLFQIQVSQELLFPHPCSHHDSRGAQIIPTYTKGITIGTYVSRTALTSRMGILHRHARFERQTTKQGTHARMLNSSLQRGTTRAPSTKGMHKSVLPTARYN